MLISRIYKSTVLVILLPFLVNVAFAQHALHEVEGFLENSSTLPFHDSVLFRSDKVMYHKKVTHSTWVTNPTSVKEKYPEDVFAVVNFDDEVYLYTLDGRKRSKELSAVVLNKKMESRIELDSSIHISGYIIGGFIENNNLFFVLLGNKGHELSIFEINKLNIVSKNTYAIPGNSIADYLTYDTHVEFYTHQSDVTSFKGHSNVKFYKYDKFYITVDEPENHLTRFITIDPQTNNISSTTFKSTSEFDFNSLFIDRKLFQTNRHKKKINVVVYDIDSQNVMTTKELSLGQPVSQFISTMKEKDVIHN